MHFPQQVTIGYNNTDINSNSPQHLQNQIGNMLHIRNLRQLALVDRIFLQEEEHSRKKAKIGSGTLPLNFYPTCNED